MNIPNFFIIGAAKAATTALSSLLEAHPQVAIVRGKEPHFFSFDDRYQLGWPWYQQLYQHRRGQVAVGDASTSYSRIRHHPAVVDRIKRHVPDAKIIYMVRHPLERMESAYIEHLCSVASHPFISINDAIRRLPMIVDSSRYWEVFAAYRKSFGESRIKIVWFEDYTANTATVFQDVCRFLEIDATVVPDIARERTNSRDAATTRMAQIGRGQLAINTVWDADLRQAVIGQIREDNLRFLNHFGRPANHWGEIF